MPNTTVEAVTEQIALFFKRHNQPVPTELEQLTVAKVVQKLKGFKGTVTWESTSAHSGHGTVNERHWGLEVAMAEAVQRAIKDSPKQSQLDFAKPAYPGDQDASIKEYLRVLGTQLLAGQETLKQGQHEIKDAVHEVKLSLDEALSMLRAQRAMMMTLLSGVDKLAPKLIVFLPAEDHRKQGVFSAWVKTLKSPQDWLSKRVKVKASWS